MLLFFKSYNLSKNRKYKHSLPYNFSSMNPVQRYWKYFWHSIQRVTIKTWIIRYISLRDEISDH